MVEKGKGEPQQPVLKQENRPEDLHAVADSYFFIVLWRPNNFALLLGGLSNIIGQADEYTFFIFHERGALVDVMNDLMQPTQRGIVPD